MKKLTKEIAEQMLANLNIADFVAKTKAASDEDTGTFEVCISTNDIDRHGDVIDQSGWSFERYMKNPVVLWGHDYWSLPIGVTEDIRVEDGKCIAKGRFAPESANPFAQQVRKLYDAGIVRATSVGFIAIEEKGNLITKAELLEFSFVPVPANPYALDMRKALELGVDTNMLAMKGIAVKAEEGDGGAETTETETSPAEVIAAEETEPKGDVATGETEVAKVLGQIVSRLDAIEGKLNDKKEEDGGETTSTETNETSGAVGANAEGSEGKDSQVGGSPKERSNASVEFDDWKAVQALCRAGVTAMTDALSVLNDRKKGKKS